MLLHQMFIKSAKENGDKIAFVDRTTGKTVSYSNALIGSIILAKQFSRYQERYVGVMLPTSAGCGLTLTGLLMAGKIPVMINYATAAADNIKFAREKCQFNTVVTSKTLLKKIECPHFPGMIFLEDIMADISTLEKLSAALISKIPTSLLYKNFHQSEPSDTAVILFTSGSEKNPKAVQLTHNNLFSNVTATHQLIQASHNIESTLTILPYFHVFGLTVCLWLPIYGGQTIITYANPLEYKTVVDIIKQEKPQFMAATPAFYQGYLRTAKPGDLASLNLCIVGADKAPDSLRKAYQSDHGIVLYEGYGTTETSPVIAVNTPDANRPGSVGKILSGVDVKIIDMETGKPVAQSEEGKILVRGDLVMKGYYRDQQETELRIIDGWYDTGDIGLIDTDGFLWHKGRLRRFIKVGGEMVSLTMVESELEKLLPAGVECCALELPDKKKGASVAVAISGNVDQQAIKKALAKHLPAIAIPRKFIVLNELPKMPNGKIDFRCTAKLIEEPGL